MNAYLEFGLYAILFALFFFAGWQLGYLRGRRDEFFHIFPKGHR
jgi:hypothetical protein